MAPWYEALRPACVEACEVAGVSLDPDVVLFYVARWCQKRTRELQPDVADLDEDVRDDVIAKVVATLGAYGERVERLAAGDKGSWTELRRSLWASARARVTAPVADECADEALQKIAVVLLTGTSPSGAAEALARGPDGPRNEYVFTSPFEAWARRVAINLLIDAGKQPTAPQPFPDRSRGLDRVTLERARDALPGLLDAIRGLPRLQRAVMVLTLARRVLHPTVRDHLHELAPDLFSEAEGWEGSSDADIARALGSTPHHVTANRSAARGKLAATDPVWELLLDVLMPHRSTRKKESRDG